MPTTMLLSQKSGPGYNCIFINSDEAVHTIKAAKKSMKMLMSLSFLEIEKNNINRI